MAANPLVSIIITTLNRRKELPLAIQSCLNQNYSNLEIIVVDDNSNYRVCDEVTSFKDSRIRYLRNESRMGLCFSRNLGIQKSSGEFINFLDDDDTLSPTKISKQINMFYTSRVEKLGVVLCNVEYLYNYSDKRIVVENALRGFLGKRLCLRSCIWATNNALFRREVLDKFSFDTRLMTHEEYDLFLRIGQKYRFDSVSEVLCQVNVSRGGIGHNFKRRLVATPRVFVKHAELFLSYGFGVFVYNLIRFSFLELLYLVSLIFGPKLYQAFFSFTSSKNQIG